MKVWDWGMTGGAAAVNIQKLLVYDDSGQIALQPSAWSPEWRAKTEETAKGNSFWSVLHFEEYDPAKPYRDHVAVRHLDGHFYLVMEIF